MPCDDVNTHSCTAAFPRITGLNLSKKQLLVYFFRKVYELWCTLTCFNTQYNYRVEPILILLSVVVVVRTCLSVMTHDTAIAAPVGTHPQSCARDRMPRSKGCRLAHTGPRAEDGHDPSGWILACLVRRAILEFLTRTFFLKKISHA